ncbi:hypothetical protein FACS1894152_3200 [Bacilli bacterium]|nr:hypothetical protein FACS1894152_3200 [Bacilli bacterium]
MAVVGIRTGEVEEGGEDELLEDDDEGTAEIVDDGDKGGLLEEGEEDNGEETEDCPVCGKVRADGPDEGAFGVGDGSNSDVAVCVVVVGGVVVVCVFGVAGGTGAEIGGDEPIGSLNEKSESMSDDRGESGCRGYGGNGGGDNRGDGDKNLGAGPPGSERRRLLL